MVLNNSGNAATGQPQTVRGEQLDLPDWLAKILPRLSVEPSSSSPAPPAPAPEPLPEAD